jgi:beta-phosphoglucomutase-like phosphatase (HAD superfamily)
VLLLQGLQLTFAGAIFDVDGVLVDSPHERAWRDTLRELMEGDWRRLQPHTTYRPERFTSQLYQERVAGKPRMAGALAVMHSFGVPSPETRAQEYADRKQRRVVELAEAGAFAAFPDALRFVLRLRAAGILLATASSSKNATLFLRAIRLDSFAADQNLRYDFLRPGTTLLDVVDADVSGRDFKRGKPDPEIFLTAAAELGAHPGLCFVVEDAVSGIAAAKAGGMDALGVARADDRALLEAAGADLVVESMDQVDVAALAARRLAAVNP